ncbi:hypothetical protein GCM10009670_26060 [Citricoccus alkalitolerans]
MRLRNADWGEYGPLLVETLNVVDEYGLVFPAIQVRPTFVGTEGITVPTQGGTDEGLKHWQQADTASRRGGGGRARDFSGREHPEERDRDG